MMDFGILFAPLLLIIAAIWVTSVLIAYERGYEAGFTDFKTGKNKLVLIEYEDGERRWVKKKSLPQGVSYKIIEP